MKSSFKVIYNPQIYYDIQKIVDYYRKETGNNLLGKRFIQKVKSELKRLNQSALHYQIRYDDIRCLPIPPFQIMAHYRVDENNLIVRVEAIIHTSKDPGEWKMRTRPDDNQN